MNDKLNHIRNLSPEEIHLLELQGCRSDDWNSVRIDTSLDLKYIYNVKFHGSVTILKGARISNVPGGVKGCVIKENALIDNVASLIFDEDSMHGVGTEVAVLDETGTRPVFIYPGLSSQIATLMARKPTWLKDTLAQGLKSFLISRATQAQIGENAIIRNCGPIKNVSIGKEIKVEGASRLENGSIINNASPGKCLSYVGNAVEAENFIIEDGILDSKSIVANCYIGQGAKLSHGFSAHDSLFFANCMMENGEAHSLLAGPYTVSMHKGSLLIGSQTSFLNAGSSTNQSNHMYKMGPIHWGVLERGVKTSSGSYLMHGSKIGAFSLLMGTHKSHPDTSQFPFSYLFSDERGSTIVVPALMLRSVGLLRDEKKWPDRDKRLNHGLPLFDHINFNVFNPFTVDTMLNAVDLINELLTMPADDDQYMRFKGLKFTRAALERAKTLYSLAIFKYLLNTLPQGNFPEASERSPEKWVDLGGQIITRTDLLKILAIDNIPEVEFTLSEAMRNFKNLELQWVAQRFENKWRQPLEVLEENSKRYDEIVEEDRQTYLQMLSDEEEMLDL